MKFQRRQVADRAAQENFEQLQTMFPLAAANIADGAVTTAKIADAAVTVAKLATGIVLELAVAGTARKVALGTGTWTWPGAQTSSSITTVTHGLGRIPLGVWVISNQDQGANEIIVADAFTYTTTTFGTRGSSKVGTSYAAATTATFVWVAIG